MRPAIRSLDGAQLAAQMGGADSGPDERLEVVRLDMGAELGERALHEPEMHRADDLAVVVGHLAEGTMLHEHVQALVVPFELGIEPERVEKPYDRGYVVLGRAGDERRPAIDEVPPPGTTGGFGLLRGVLRRPGEIAREDLRQQPIARALLLRHAVGCGAIDETRPAGPRALLGARGDQLRLRQDVEVRANRVGVEPDPLGQLGGVERTICVAQELENTNAARVPEGPVDTCLVDAFLGAHGGYY